MYLIFIDEGKVMPFYPMAEVPEFVDLRSLTGQEGQEGEAVGEAGHHEGQAAGEVGHEGQTDEKGLDNLMEILPTPQTRSTAPKRYLHILT